MLAYVVILLAVLYLVLHYTGLFEEIARFLGGGSSRSSGRSIGRDDKDDQRRRLEVFEDFFGQSGEDDK